MIATVPRILILLCAFVCGLAGCGSSPETHPVSGKVVKKNGKAWPGGTITFQLDSDPTINATGEIQKDGNFTLSTHYVSGNRGSMKPGAPVGQYTVTVEQAYGEELPNVIKGNSVNQKFTVKEGVNAFVVEVVE